MNHFKHLRIHLYILFAFLIFNGTTKAQSGKLTGNVTDASNGEPLIGANIVILELENTGTATNINGSFELMLPVGSYSLKASLIGYTPVVKTDVREGAVKWSNGWWVPTENINGARYPDYHRLDIAFNSRYNFNSWTLSVFLSLQNIYNRKNIAFYEYVSDGTIENVYQFSFLPVAGIEILF